MTASKREKELARQRAERQAARQAAASARRRQRRAVLASVIALALVAAGVGALAATLSGADDQPESDAAAAASPTAASTRAAGDPGCAYRPSGTAARKVELPPTEGVETSQGFTATIVTNRGDIVVDLLTREAPCTVNSFRSLAHFRFFDNTPCPRLTTAGIFVLQCGDPTGTRTGGPGYVFDSENLEGAAYPRGTVAMANSGGTGTNGSQFFLVHQDSPLPPQYTPFGRVTKGLEVLDAVAKAGSTDPGGDGAPKQPVTIKRVQIRPTA